MEFVKVNLSEFQETQKIYLDTTFIANLILGNKYGFSTAVKRAKERGITPSSIRANVTTNLYLNTNIWHDLEEGSSNAKRQISNALIRRYPDKEIEVQKIFRLKNL